MKVLNISSPPPARGASKRDYSRMFHPPKDAKTYTKEYDRYGVTVTVWDAWAYCDTFGARLVLSLDTEYEFNPEISANDILSYQVVAYGWGPRMVQLIFHIPDNSIGFRLSLAEIIDETRKALGLKPSVLRYKRNKPGAIRLIAHFTSAEWGALRDRDALAPALKIVRKSPITLGASQVRLKLSNRKVCCGLEVVDTTLIAPGKYRSLAKIGDVLGFAKVSLPEGAISQMSALRRSDPDLFDRYAITDARVALGYYLEMERVARHVLGLEKLGPTLGALATTKYVNTIGEENYERYFGLETYKEHRKTKVAPNAMRDQTESFAAAAFMGGLNMAYPREISGCLILDIDFTSCYPSAGATLPVIHWDGLRGAGEPEAEDVQLIEGAGDGGDEAVQPDPPPDTPTTDPSSTPIMIAYVKFSFPATCKRPTIPVMAGARGLIYPLHGEGYATHFELEAARGKGAEIQVIREQSFPATILKDGRHELAFAEFFKLMVAERNKYPKDSLENLIYKEVSNSAYGKLAQGVKPRNTRSFATRTTLPMSRITCPAYACAITGLVRAALIELMDAAEEVGGVVLAATTDGAMIAFPKLTYFPEADIDDIPGLYTALLSKPAIAALSQGRVNMGCPPSPVEVKHVGDEAIIMKTRGYILRANQKTQHLAKAGIQMWGGDADAQAARLEAYYESELIETWHMQTLASAQNVWDRKVADVIMIKDVNPRRVNVDFDFKVIPDDSGGFRPPVNLEEFESYRETVDNIRRRPKPKKRGAVCGQQQDTPRPARRATIDRVRLAQAGVRVCGSEEDTLRRMFLYAVAQDIAGLYPRGPEGLRITQAELAKRLNVPLSAVKNAVRRTYTQLPFSQIALITLIDFLYDAHQEFVPYQEDMDVLFLRSG